MLRPDDPMRTSGQQMAKALDIQAPSIQVPLIQVPSAPIARANEVRSGQSGLMPATLTTLSHFSNSAAM